MNNGIITIRKLFTTMIMLNSCFAFCCECCLFLFFFVHSFLALLYKTICYFIFGAILDKSPIEWQVTMNCYVAWTDLVVNLRNRFWFFCYFKFVDCGQISYSKTEYSTLNFDWNSFCSLFCGRNCICFAYITIDEFNWMIFVRNRCALEIRSFIRLIWFLIFFYFFFFW